MNWEVRQYQQEAVAACLAGFAGRGCTSVMLESPVGSGKTYMALEVIHALQERLGRRFKVNWVAPRHHLLQQVMEANRDLHRDVVRPVSLFERTPPEADFVVLDEAHHEATQTCILLYEKMKGDYVLGLSAMPPPTRPTRGCWAAAGWTAPSIAPQDASSSRPASKCRRSGRTFPFFHWNFKHCVVGTDRRAGRCAPPTNRRVNGE